MQRKLKQWLPVLLLAGGGLWAEVEMPAVFSDGMVLQRGMPVKVWGFANDREPVTVKFQDQVKRTVSVGGRWEIELDALDAGGPHEMEVLGYNEVVIKDILVGEVWLASGQSNMKWQLGQTVHAEESLAGVEGLDLRVFNVRERSLDAPDRDVEGEWLLPNREAMASISAVAYLFGREIHETQGVPVGILLPVKGGTRVVNWTSREVLARNPDAYGHFSYYHQLVEAYPKAMADWRASGAEDGKPASPTRRLPTGYFNGMVNGLVPYSLRGIIWYQGETDTWNAEEYTRMFPELIQDWRDRWGLGDIPFFYVQLAGYNGKEGVDANYPYLRDIQLETLDRLPNLGMAVAIDAGEEHDIHPRDKRPVGHRLALLARNRVYGEAVPDSGPVLREVVFKNKTAIARFEELHGGLEARGGPLHGFELAGVDGTFHAAKARIVDDAVHVEAAAVAEPRYLRYAFHGYPEANLYNAAGLPASPFRTDDFPRGQDAVRSVPE